MQVTAETIVRGTLGLADSELRAAYVAGLLRDVSSAELAPALDLLAQRAEQAEENAREALVAVVDALNLPASVDAAQRLREEAAGASLLALERLIRLPPPSRPEGAAPLRPERVPDYGAGRPLTLGERKALARRPDRQVLERLLADPHPDVVHRLLVNPRLTEADVLRLAARRPNRPELLAEIARSPWIKRSRVRMAIMLNPDTPPAIAVPISGLLMRQELALVAEATHVAAPIRALCMERLERRPPSAAQPSSSSTSH